MLRHEFLESDGILLLEPIGPLQAEDFETVARIVDPFIEQHGGLMGLMISATRFPGWASFGALVSHLRFVRDHHKKVARIAAVTDDGFLAVMPKFANHFVQAEIRHFPLNQREEALQWLRGK